MEILFESYLHKICKVEFYFSRKPERTMSYTGMVEGIVRESEQAPHIVLNVHYAGRVQLELRDIKSIHEAEEDYFSGKL
jgi:hypothetical protein